MREVTLLGQNVNSWRDNSKASLQQSPDMVSAEPGSSSVYKPKKGGARFSATSGPSLSGHQVDPGLRVMFISPHPNDLPLEVLELISELENL